MTKRTLQTKHKHYIAYGVALMIMGLLFYSSSQPYEQQKMDSFLTILLPNKPFEEWLHTIALTYGETVVTVSEMGYYHFIEFFIRKFIHFTSFCLLAYSWIYALQSHIKERKMAIIIGLLISVCYAASDEFHQSLTPQRTALLQDVILDSFGALAGSVIFVIMSPKKTALKRYK